MFPPQAWPPKPVIPFWNSRDGERGSGGSRSVPVLDRRLGLQRRSSMAFHARAGKRAPKARRPGEERKELFQQMQQCLQRRLPLRIGRGVVQRQGAIVGTRAQTLELPPLLQLAAERLGHRKL